MSRWNNAAALVAGALFFLAGQGATMAQLATADDAARFLAGLRPSTNSPLTTLTHDPAWQRHARWLDANWSRLETRQLSKVRAWSERYLQNRQFTLYYMFSGPDFLYADAFFPGAKIYLLSGLEPVGAIPIINQRSIRSLTRIESSIAASMELSFFITRDMRRQLEGGDLAGTLPILYVYAARLGKRIHNVSRVALERDGSVHPTDGSMRGKTPGVKIIMSNGHGALQTLYYFQTDLSNGGVKNSGFLKFAATLGPGHGLLKSASYLMHSGNFTLVRNFVLEHSRSIVQDDSGIPLRAFKPDMWEFYPFGKYLGPIAVFPGRQQRQLAALFKRSKPPPLEFGIGYRHRGYDSNLLLAVKRIGKPTQASRSNDDTLHQATAADRKKIAPINSEE